MIRRWRSIWPGVKSDDTIMEDPTKLEREEMIRIIDLLFVQKDAETGDLLALGYQAQDLVAIVGHNR
jgi:hypothetical protein